MKTDFLGKMKIEGLDKFAHGLADLPERSAGKVLTFALRKAAEYLQRGVEDRAPYKTGELQASFKVKKYSDPNRFSRDVRLIATAKYALMVEYGGRYVIKRGKKIIREGAIRAQPYMRPAYDAEQEPLVSMISEDLGASVARAFKRLKNG